MKVSNLRHFACAQRRLRQKLQEKRDLLWHHKNFVLNWNAWVHRDPIHSEAIMERVCQRFVAEHAEARPLAAIAGSQE